MPTIQLTKHHGLGNDFLVMRAVEERSHHDHGRLAQWLCHRTRGVGADGLMIIHDEVGYDARMELRNADGSVAAMSGNGIRCFAQALAMESGSLDRQRIATDAGERTVELASTTRPDTVQATVSMGAVSDIDAPEAWYGLGVDPGRPVAHLSLGNPHTVVGVSDVDDVDLVDLGTRLSEVNLEIIEPGSAPGSIVMRVHERGVGITEACGTGACAAAVAAVRWGLVPASIDEIEVCMPGGAAIVRLADDGVYLSGPATFICRVDVEI